MHRLGSIVRLQVQRTSLKRPLPLDEGGGLYYDPSGLVEVPALMLTAAGIVGLMANLQQTVDVHHVDHPMSRSKNGTNSISFGFTSHYASIRDYFAARIPDGVAGENLIIETDASIDLQALSDGLIMKVQGDSDVLVRGFSVAEPCVEFTQYCLGHSRANTPEDIRAGLQFLRRGTRGFYAGYAGRTVVLRLGDEVFLSGS
jgi:hypothetical protein